MYVKQSDKIYRPYVGLRRKKIQKNKKTIFSYSSNEPIIQVNILLFSFLYLELHLIYLMLGV